MGFEKHQLLNTPIMANLDKIVNILTLFYKKRTKNTKNKGNKAKCRIKKISRIASEDLFIFN